MRSKRKSNKLIIAGIIIDALICCTLFILYGPWSYFRDFWITTAMTTMNHKYLAHIFYSEKTIEEVMANNTIVETNESTDTDLINKDETVVYADKYDEQILKRDKKDLYKVINICGDGYKGFLIAVYDPANVKLAITRYLNVRGEKVTNLAENTNALVAINASGFLDPNEVGNGGTPTGSVVKDGKIVFQGYKTNISGGIIGFDDNNHLILSKESMKTALDKYNLRDAVEFGPFLIVNGKPSFIKGNGGWGIAPRTVIGQRSDGIVLFLIIDGRKPGYSLGADMVELTRIMTNYKAINAANLDGGASTSLAINKVLTNKPAGYSGDGQRKLPNAWIVTK